MKVKLKDKIGLCNNCGWQFQVVVNQSQPLTLTLATHSKLYVQWVLTVHVGTIQV